MTNRLIYGLGMLAVLLIGGCVGVAQTTNEGNRALNAGDALEALRLYQQAQVNEPDRAELYYNAGLAYVALDDFSRAIDAFNQALLSAEGDLRSRVYFSLGNAYAETREDANAIEAYRAGLRLNPADDQMRHNLEVLLLRYVQPTATAQQQQTEPDDQQTDPSMTPTDDPGGFDPPTVTPPPVDFDPTQPPESGGQDRSDQEDSATVVPLPQGGLTIEQAERILDQVEQDQQSLREFELEDGGSGESMENDW
ncbi:MAG: tetratricopeptide repeat protein [Anaerolineaceae bacterium]|nr:MAG: tetratricopeptide repeat protein [Anaerolineaceae bacterium]